ncbi:MAG: hypothetical protein HY841_14455 [Bacteroidetes bacterium]|nr:hypothetical protein [Bacteroidota bacterium]
MIPTEVIICKVDMGQHHPMDGFYYVASGQDGEPQTQPEITVHKAVESFSRFYKSSTGTELDKLSRKILLHVGYCSLQEDL